eukprot:COSAG06_NODE_5362_length_3526_cov_40.855601_3_plen_243_part_00
MEAPMLRVCAMAVLASLLYGVDAGCLCAFHDTQPEFGDGCWPCDNCGSCEAGRDQNGYYGYCSCEGDSSCSPRCPGNSAHGDGDGDSAGVPGWLGVPGGLVGIVLGAFLGGFGYKFWKYTIFLLGFLMLGIPCAIAGAAGSASECGLTDGCTAMYLYGAFAGIIGGIMGGVCFTCWYWIVIVCSGCGCGMATFSFGLLYIAGFNIASSDSAGERAVREEGVGAGHRARAGELGYGGGSQGVE